MERVGITGLQAAGKTSLFRALTGLERGRGHTSRNINLGVVSVPDTRLEVLAEMEHSKKIVPAQVEFSDVAMLAGGSEKSGLGGAQLGKLREVDALVCVVRAFDAPEVPHPEGSVDPARDLASIETELCLADLEAATRATHRYKKLAKSGDAQQRIRAEQAEAIEAVLEAGIPVRRVADLDVPPDLFLITDKPVIYVVNIGEDQIAYASEIENELRDCIHALDQGENEHPEFLAICVQVEAEASELDPDARGEFLEAYGLGAGVTPRLIRAVYDSLDLITFLTTGEPETRAWTLRKGSRAPQAAGRIHSDMERGFIRMEVIAYEDLVEAGSMKSAKEKGMVRVEGKDYIVREGDVVHVRFNL